VASEKGGRLLVEETAAPSVRLSSVELMQVLLNLLTNAAQALHPQLPERRIQLSAREAAGGVEFLVADTGPGMTAEQLARAGRERFTTKPEGTGLGLSIVRRITQAAGGRFELESAPGQGTQARVWLPRA
jgi:two-component system sensor histidine kinase FlrB